MPINDYINENTLLGAGAGTGLGALAGYFLSGKDEQVRNSIIGALTGGVAGGLGGHAYNMYTGLEKDLLNYQGRVGSLESSLQETQESLEDKDELMQNYKEEYDRVRKGREIDYEEAQEYQTRLRNELKGKTMELEELQAKQRQGK